jgi:uracil-DNA glycosylase
MRRSFERFVEDLAGVKLSDGAFNQYARGGSATRANAMRRANLRLYFEQISQRRPSTLLVGEAPSYRGGRLTGVPFVSETILLCGIEQIGMFGAQRGYRRTGEFERISTEASATIVWATIRHFDPLPLLWNAFPFHPYRGQNQRTNRMPWKRELEMGHRFLRDLLELFPVDNVIAVGNQAACSLSDLGIDHARVRHPSQGGKLKFVQGLQTLMQS